MAKIPYNIEFCQSQDCKHLRGNKCKKKECIYNLKWIKYWETYGIYPPEGVKDA